MERKNFNRVEIINKINFRYFLVSIASRYYIVDYADPGNFKDYFVGLYPERVKEYKIYDVTEDYKQFISFQKKSVLSIKNFTIIFILYMLHVMLFPKKINLAYITKSHYILNHLIFYFFLSLISLILTIFFINIKNKEMDLSKYNVKRLIYNSDKKNNKIKVILSLVVSYLTLWLMAIWGSNYSNLILFGFILTNSIFFIKFIEFQPSLNGKNYYIEEK